MELRHLLVVPAREFVDCGDAFVLQADQIIAVNVHSLIGVALLLVALPFKLSQIDRFLGIESQRRQQRCGHQEVEKQLFHIDSECDLPNVQIY